MTATQEAVFKSMGYSSNQLRSDINSIKQWFDQQPHLPQHSIDDTLITSFLIGCKGSLQKTKFKLDNYFSVRKQMPLIFGNRDPCDPEFLSTANSKPVVTLAKFTDDHCRVHLTWTEDDDPDAHDITCWIKRAVSQLDIIIRTDPFALGDYFLVSGNKFSFSQGRKITADHIKTLFYLAERVFPIRLKGIVFYDAPPACVFLVDKLIKPLISEKMSKRILVINENYSPIYNMISVKILPKELGGEGPTLRSLNTEWIKRLESWKSWFLGNGMELTEEKLRPQQLKPSDMFGISGSFRSLTID